MDLAHHRLPAGQHGLDEALAAMADLDTFEVLPWDPRVARVYLSSRATV